MSLPALSAEAPAPAPPGDVAAHAPPARSSPSASSTISSINAQLLSHGWAKRPLDLSSLPDKDQDAVVTVLFDLLGSNITNLSTLDELSARHRTLSYEHERLGKSSAQVRTSRDRLTAETTRWAARYADLEKRLALEEERTKGLKEEVARGRKALDGVRVAAGQNAKKMQAKLDKAVVQLTRSDTPRSHGLVLLNPIAGNKPAPVARGQAPLLEQALKEMADIREGLQEETEAFRHVIVSTANSLRETVALATGQEPPTRMLQTHFFSNPSSSRTSSHSTHGTFQSSSSTSHPSIADTRLRALAADIHTHLTSGLPAPSRSAGPDGAGLAETEEEVEERKRAEREREKVLTDLEDRVKDLEVEVQCAQARENEAKRVVEEMTKAQIQAGMDAARAGEDDDMIDLRAEVARQKRLLDDEKRKFTDATIRLGADRQRLESERQAFLDERRRADTESVLALLPNSPGANVGGLSHLAVPAPQIGNPLLSPHRPYAPSPLSPMHPRHAHAHAPSSPVGHHGKPRTPKAHSAKRGGARAKTPLSRLVLEKTVREKSRATAVASQLAAAAAVVAASGSTTDTTTTVVAGAGAGSMAAPLVEGGRRVNLAGSTTLTTSTMGKPKPKTTTPTGSAALGASVKGKTTTPPGPVPTLASSTGGLGGRVMPSSAAALARSVGGRKVELGKADGIGPKSAAKATRVWR